MVTMLSHVHGFFNGMQFRDSHENLEDDNRSGWPTAVRTPDMIKTVHEMISTDRRMTHHMMEEELEMTRQTICIG
jgi:hypothetical protein